MRAAEASTPTAVVPGGTRGRIVAAAGEVFAEHGFRVATVRQITERAGVNLAAVNYHFRDKAELYAHVLLHAHAAAQHVGARSEGEHGSPEVRLRAFVGEFLRYLLDPARPAWHGRVKAREMAEPTPALDRLVEETIRPMTRTLRAILRDLAGARLAEDRLDLLCGSVLGQCLYYSQCRPMIERCLPGFGLDGPEDIERLADHITDFSLTAIRGVPQPKKHAAAKKP